MLKKLLWLLILIVVILTGCANKNNKADLYQQIINKDKIVVGISFDSRPFGFKDSNGQIKGMEADLARKVAEEILGNKDKVEFKNITTQGRIKAAMSGDVDMVISTMTITPERKKLVGFSEPYFVAGQVICVRKDSKIESIYDLINKRVIVELDTTGEQNIKRFVPNALIQAYSNNAEAINAFKSGAGDAITTDDSLLQELVSENSTYRFLPKKLTKEPYGIAFKKSKHTKLFKKNLDAIINRFKFDGTLDNIKEKWGIY